MLTRNLIARYSGFGGFMTCSSITLASSATLDHRRRVSHFDLGNITPFMYADWSESLANYRLYCLY